MIDFDSLRLSRREAIFDLPTGGKRLVQRVSGYTNVVKSGKSFTITVNTQERCRAS